AAKKGRRWWSGWHAAQSGLSISYARVADLPPISTGLHCCVAHPNRPYPWSFACCCACVIVHECYRQQPTSFNLFRTTFPPIMDSPEGNVRTFIVIFAVGLLPGLRAQGSHEEC